MRKQLGAILCVTGGLLLSFAGGRYAIGAVRADAARDAWDRARASAAVAAARNEALAPLAQVSTARGAPVARIEIPRLSVDAIVLEGVGDDELNAGPGHLPGSALPGEPGNSVLSAHRDRHFKRLGEIALGDTVITESGARRTLWVVSSRRVIDRNDPALFQTKSATLTLTTCWPIRYLGPAPDRLIVTALPVSAKPAR